SPRPGRGRAGVVWIRPFSSWCVVLSTQVVRACAGRTTSWGHKVPRSCERSYRKFPGGNCCGAVGYLLTCTVHGHGSVPKTNSRRRYSYKSISDPVLTRVVWLLLGKERHAAEKNSPGERHPGAGGPLDRRLHPAESRPTEHAEPSCATTAGPPRTRSAGQRRRPRRRRCVPFRWG